MACPAFAARLVTGRAQWLPSRPRTWKEEQLAGSLTSSPDCDSRTTASVSFIASWSRRRRTASPSLPSVTFQVQGGIEIPVELHATGTFVDTLVQGHLAALATAAAQLRAGEPAVRLDDFDAPLHAAVDDLVLEAAQSSIGQCARTPLVLQHVSEAQRLQGHRTLVGNQLRRRLVAREPFLASSQGLYPELL